MTARMQSKRYKLGRRNKLMLNLTKKMTEGLWDMMEATRTWTLEAQMRTQLYLRHPRLLQHRPLQPSTSSSFVILDRLRSSSPLAPSTSSSFAFATSLLRRHLFQPSTSSLFVVPVRHPCLFSPLAPPTPSSALDEQVATHTRNNYLSSPPQLTCNLPSTRFFTRSPRSPRSPSP